jgi:hypothetical protein
MAAFPFVPLVSAIYEVYVSGVCVSAGYRPRSTRSIRPCLAIVSNLFPSRSYGYCHCDDDDLLFVPVETTVTTTNNLPLYTRLGTTSREIEENQNTCDDGAIMFPVVS